MKEEIFGIFNILKLPNRQINKIKEILRPHNLDDHIIPVEGFEEATEKIIKIANTLGGDNRDQKNEQNLSKPNIFCDFDGVIRPNLINFPPQRKWSIIRALVRLVKTADSFTICQAE